ncbi:MAG: tRNA pseudouridine(55) synthase TruB [Gemmatimonadaceae bacterium]|nr:tRNA pseudouridine(55) synthase TruB [Gemmatimonadaceae bacterium]
MLLVDKPSGMTSHDVVSVVRRAARTKRVGHAGTLDPFATGLLVVAVGSCTRLLPYLDAEPKVYDSTFRFGVETDTDDATGLPMSEAATPTMLGWPHPLTAAIASLTGTIQQVPPSFSAKHINGERAYAVARRGDAVVLPPVAVTVHEWEVRAQGGERLDVRITCSGGTYIRALARDLGRALGSAAHCATLRRIASGRAHVDQAVSIDQLMPGAIADGAVPLRSPLPLLSTMTVVELDDAAVVALSHGRAFVAHSDGKRAVLVRDGAVVGIAERIDDAVRGPRWQPKVVLLEGDA